VKVRKAGGDQWGAGADSLARGLRQRGHVGGAAQEAAQLVQCALGEVRVRGNGLGKGQVVVVRLAEVVACRRRKQARRACEER
jgi:hypothetical protein